MKRQHNMLSSKILCAVFETTLLRNFCQDTNHLERSYDCKIDDCYLLNMEKLKKLLATRTDYNEYDLINHIKTYCDSINSGDEFDFFDIVFDFADNMIVRADNHFCFKYDFTDIWIETVRKIGEELIVTAGVVLDDLRCGVKDQNKMDWQYCIEHNNHELKKLLNRGCGVSENHFHLRSSSPYFDISWIYLMNDVENGKYQREIEFFQNNLLNESPYHISDYSLSMIWRKAATLRIVLYELNNTEDNAKIKELHKFADEIISYNGSKCEYSNINKIQTRINRLPKLGIDYAGKSIIYTSQQCNFVSGERYILYNCLRKIVLKETGYVKLSAYLFLYLIMKNRFYSEMVQSNGRKGFYNFNLYQARKDSFIPWENEENVAAETIYSVLDGPKMYSFELRIYPPESPGEISKSIHLYDKAIEKAKKLLKKRRGITYSGTDFCYYTLHFIKTPEDDCEESKCKRCIKCSNCRDSERRNRIERQTAAIMQLSSESLKRIRGIDAAGEEIKCRPEIFAKQFRRLLYYFKPDSTYGENNQLKATYHVGEDNYDIVDGIRAIYEAVYFLDLRSGCRLGHATLLGNDPEEYYNYQRNPIAIPCQIFLDNLVWMYYFINEHQILFDKSDLLSDYINKNFQVYFSKIYGSELSDLKIESMVKMDRKLSLKQKNNLLVDFRNIEYNISDYYYSYMLRGDDPELYRRFYTNEPLNLSYSEQYRICSTHEDMQNARNNIRAKYLYYLYHYSCSVKKNGNQLIYEKLPDYFIKCVKLIQKKLQELISFKGIAIETNPSSNKLISTFNSYADHPISVYYDHALLNDSSKTQLNVSINTDDRSVFSTSLVNEYAYLMFYLENKKDINGNNVYTRFNILQWLDEIRRTGNEQSFRLLQKNNANDYI